MILEQVAHAHTREATESGIQGIGTGERLVEIVGIAVVHLRYHFIYGEVEVVVTLFGISERLPGCGVPGRDHGHWLRAWPGGRGGRLFSAHFIREHIIPDIHGILPFGSGHLRRHLHYRCQIVRSGRTVGGIAQSGFLLYHRICRDHAVTLRTARIEMVAAILELQLRQSSPPCLHIMLQERAPQIGELFLHGEVAVVDGRIDMTHHTIVAYKIAVPDTVAFAQEGVVHGVILHGLQLIHHWCIGKPCEDRRSCLEIEEEDVLRTIHQSHIRVGP